MTEVIFHILMAVSIVVVTISLVKVCSFFVTSLRAWIANMFCQSKKLTDLRAQEKELLQKLERIRSDIAAAEVALKDIYNETEKHKSIIQEADRKVHDLESKERLMKEKELQLENDQEKNNQHSAELEEDRKGLIIEKQTLLQRKKRISFLVGQLSDPAYLEKRLVKLHERTLKDEAGFGLLKEAIRDRVEQILRLQEEKARLENESSNSSEKVKHLEEDTADLRRQLGDFQAKADSLTKERQAVLAELDAKKDFVAQTPSSIQNLRKEISSLDSKVSLLTVELGNLTERRDALKVGEKELSEKLVRLKDECEELNKKNQGLTRAVKKAEEERQAFNDSIRAYETELSDMQKKVSSLRNEKAKLEQVTAEKKQELELKNQELEDARQYQSRIKKELETANEKEVVTGEIQKHMKAIYAILKNAE